MSKKNPNESKSFYAIEGNEKAIAKITNSLADYEYFVVPCEWLTDCGLPAAKSVEISVGPDGTTGDSHSALDYVPVDVSSGKIRFASGLINNEASPAPSASEVDFAISLAAAEVLDRVGGSRLIDAAKHLLAADFENFEPDGNNAFATGAVLDAHIQETHQEWCERGTVNGTAVEVYWLFENSEADCEDGADMPFDESHISRIEIVEA